MKKDMKHNASQDRSPIIPLAKEPYPVRLDRAVPIVLQWASESFYTINPNAPVASYIAEVRNFIGKLGVEIHPKGQTDEELARSYLLEMERVGLMDLIREEEHDER